MSNQVAWGHPAEAQDLNDSMGMITPLEAAGCGPVPRLVPETPSRRYVEIEPHTTGQLRVLTVGDVELHLDGHRVLVHGEPADMPRKEFQVLELLMTNAGRVMSRQELLDAAWGPGIRESRNYLEVHVTRLRGKIGRDRIRTVRGIGYVFDLQ